MRPVLALLLLLAAAPAARCQLQSLISLDRLNERLAGRVVDYTHNHGRDNRPASHVLGQRRDLYVYLPPGYDPRRCYPLVLWLHGAFGDEHSFLDTAQLEYLDCLIRRGRFPAAVVACPDGSLGGRNLVTAKQSLYVNGCRGRFEDHVVGEVIPFLSAHYSLRPERAAHAVIGVSSGGFGAMNLALKHRDYFGAVVTLAGAINLRYDNCRRDYFEDFHPATYRWKDSYDPRELVGVLGGGLVRIRAGTFLEPVFGSGPCVLERIARENPADLLARGDLRPGELSIRVAYGARDELNFDAHAESFAWLAAQKGVEVELDRDPEGTHGFSFFRPAQRRAYVWLARHLLPPTP
jgi:S-formylglutathione hydrolase FrmB